MTRVFAWIIASGAATLIAVMAATDAPPDAVRIPGSNLPTAVVALGDSSAIAALAIADDGSRAAGAFPGDKPNRSVVRISPGPSASAAEIPIRGAVRALRFGRDGTQLFVVATRQSKNDDADTFLCYIDVATLDVSREIVLPRAASDVDAIDARTLVVASQGELRTFFAPSVSSGPLYRLDGSNRALAAIPGTRRLLIGRPEAIVLVDLDDQQSRDGLSARDSMAVPSPVAAIAIAPDGSEALARLTDGEVLRFRVEPLGGATSDGHATAIAWPGEREDAPPPKPPPAARSEPSPELIPEPVVVAASAPPAAPAPNPTPTPGGPPGSASAPMPQSAPAPSPQAAPVQDPLPSPPSVPTHEESPLPPSTTPSNVEPSAAPPQVPTESPKSPPPETPPSAPSPTSQAGRPPDPSSGGSDAAPSAPTLSPESEPARQDGALLRGRVTGNAAARIVEVVILGPDNLLREAARVRPSSDGTWAAGGLAPGTYRVVLDAGSGRAVDANPAFRTVRVERNATADAGPIEARRIL